jgi:hypothetical protein
MPASLRSDYLIHHPWQRGKIIIAPRGYFHRFTHKEFHEFRGQVLRGFIDYAEDAFLTWVDENDLPTSE